MLSLLYRIWGSFVHVQRKGTLLTSPWRIPGQAATDLSQSVDLQLDWICSINQKAYKRQKSQAVQLLQEKISATSLR